MNSAQFVLTTDGLQTLLEVLKQRGYRVVGPTVHEQAIIYDDIHSIDDLPRGWTDEQDGKTKPPSRRISSAILVVHSIFRTRLCGIAANKRSGTMTLAFPARPILRLDLDQS